MTSSRGECLASKAVYHARPVLVPPRDREWDVPFEVNRAELLGILDEVINLLEAQPEFRAFHLDGQVVPLEDYLVP